MSDDQHTAELKRTPLFNMHAEAGGRMVAFAGYEMPVQYRDGILAEHRWTRAKAGLFDVSHMGQAWLRTRDAELSAPDAHDKVAAALETLVPSDIASLAPGEARYTLLMNDQGGALDDLIVTRPYGAERQGYVFLVVNASRKADDYAHIAARLGDRCALEIKDDRSLLALQGPQAEAALESVAPGVSAQTFMGMRPYQWNGADLLVSRSGYTGEDGFEISVPNDHAAAFADALLAHDDVAWIGLGARDSLRLEAGLCLYGQDIDETTSPVEAALTWTIAKSRRETGGFPGFERIKAELAGGAARKRVGLKPHGQGIPRHGAEVLQGDRVVGTVTSGVFGPTVKGAVAMGYVETALAKPDAELEIALRGKRLKAVVTRMPFVEHRYKRA